MSKEKTINKKAGNNKQQPDMNNRFVRAYNKCGKELTYTTGKKYKQGMPRGDFSKVFDFIGALEKAGLKVEPSTKSSEDYEPQVYTKSGIRVGKIGIRNGCYFSIWKHGSTAVKIVNDEQLKNEIDAVVTLADELDRNHKLRPPVSKKKITPETISALKKRMMNLSPKSKGISLKSVSSEIKEFAEKEGYTLVVNDDGTGILKP